MSSVNLAKSAEIYRAIMNGKVINHYQVSSDGSQSENPLFTEIYYNFNNYKQQYLMSGFDLVVKDDFYYAREIDSDMPFTDSVKRIQTLLLIISRYVTLSGALFEKLTNPMGGITTEDIQKMSENEEYTEILEAVEIKSLVSGIKTHLIDRNIMIEPRSDRYILSDAGKFFFNELFDR
ncbi:MAG: hypothetical protein RPS47_02655 [Colwellia sp.]|jgi:hypothetical protein